MQARIYPIPQFQIYVSHRPIIPISEHISSTARSLSPVIFPMWGPLTTPAPNQVHILLETLTFLLAATCLPTFQSQARRYMHPVT